MVLLIDVLGGYRRRDWERFKISMALAAILALSVTRSKTPLFDGIFTHRLRARLLQFSATSLTLPVEQTGFSLPCKAWRESPRESLLFVFVCILQAPPQLPIFHQRACDYLPSHGVALA